MIRAWCGPATREFVHLLCDSRSRLRIINQIDRCDKSCKLDLDILIEAVAEVCFYP